MICIVYVIKIKKTYVVTFVANQFSEAAIVQTMWYGRFKRCEVTVVNFNIFFAILLHSIFFRQSTSSIFQWSKHGGWYILIVALKTIINLLTLFPGYGDPDEGTKRINLIRFSNRRIFFKQIKKVVNSNHELSNRIR